MRFMTLNTRRAFALLAAVIFSWPSTSEATNPSFIELTADGNNVQGKIYARDDETVWLIQRDGQLEEIEMDSVTAFRQVASRFQFHSHADIRSSLIKEFGNKYEYAGTTHYTVCGPRGQAKQYAQVLEKIYRVCHRYFSVRRFKIEQPKHPLTAIIFPSRKDFAEYCEDDDVTPSRGLRGYYSPDTNRIALFADPKSSNRQQTSSWKLPIPPRNPMPFRSLQRGSVFARQSTFPSIEAGLKDTLIHEATHQVAFNFGLHQRIGDNPRWVVEGLATVFEAPGIRDSNNVTNRRDKLNLERYLRFQNYAKDRRVKGVLAAFVESDRPFSSVLDAYAESWALTYFLIETRPRAHESYLKTIATRDPFEDYDKYDRRDDFETAFGDDLNILEVSFLRYIASLKD